MLLIVLFAIICALIVFLILMFFDSKDFSNIKNIVIKKIDGKKKFSKTFRNKEKINKILASLNELEEASNKSDVAYCYCISINYMSGSVLYYFNEDYIIIDNVQYNTCEYLKSLIK